jgi:nicotinate-nucleotide--dimethylbenzimidazole phosphoribosyltransferase
LQSTVLEKIVSGLEQQVANLEASMAAFADSFTTKRIVTQELCVADGSGAQTCITKAQLDALLRGAAQLGQAPAATEPEMTEQTASADQPVAPAAAVAAAAPPEMPPAIDASNVPLPVVRPQAGESSPGETAEALPEVAAVLPSAAEPTSGQPTAASSEAAAPLPAEATAAPPSSEPAETIVAASAKPETVVTAERPAKDEEAASVAPRDTDLATPEPNAVPAEAPPVSERLE